MKHVKMPQKTILLFLGTLCKLPPILWYILFFKLPREYPHDFKDVETCSNVSKYHNIASRHIAQVVIYC